MQQSLVTGAGTIKSIQIANRFIQCLYLSPSPPPLSHSACDLVLLGNLEVSGSSGDAVIGDAAQQLKALDLPTITIVNFKASNNGITITDSTSG